MTTAKPLLMNKMNSRPKLTDVGAWIQDHKTSDMNAHQALLNFVTNANPDTKSYLGKYLYATSKGLFKTRYLNDAALNTMSLR